ncbi:MAG: Cof-type HAD-IIB family hydrolase, partial [Dehalococcoidales bacterium]|nr:Cof-type HAD-IIB family hydrolase [Dehalococcoidales bacterium]
MADKPYRLLVIDIDGTLVDKNGTITPDNREALTRVSGLGIMISLSTGRAIRACLSLINQLELDGYHIFFDGALVSTPGHDKEVYANPLCRETVKQAVEFAHENDINLDLYSASHYFIERESWSSDIHNKFFGIEPTITEFNGIWERERIIKGGMVATSPQETAQVRAIRTRFNSSLHFSRVRTPSYPGVDFINIVAPGVSKGTALEALAGYLGISLSEIMAIGDGENDIPLIASAGLGIAMGNAPDEVKAIADGITLDIEHNGLA